MKPTHQDVRQQNVVESASQSWRSALITPSEIETLVDRLSATLQAQSHTVRELEAAHIELDARGRALDEARAKAERATETLATFLKALGHDLRAPLVSVDAALQMLDFDIRDGGPTTATERIGEIRRTASHGLALIDDLFELIRSDAGQWRVEPQAVRISEIVADARAVVTPKAQLKRLTIETRWIGSATDSKHFVQTDLVRIRQALVNLLVNAIHAMAEGGTLTLTTRDAGADSVEIAVTDTGPGLGAALLAELFKPFVTRKKDGTGLGLWISRSIVERYGGDIQAGNHPAGGAIMRVLLVCDRD